jgi:hypothetical protein
MKEERPNEIARGSDAGGTMAAEIAGENLSSSKPTLSQAPKNGSSGEPTASGPGSTSLIRKATGPRTERGKERSRRNAIKRGIFSKVVVLKRESQADFDAFRNALREDRQPKGAQEEIYVNVLAVLWWRLLRVWDAETGEIQSGMEFLQWDANERNRQDAARLPQLSCNGGLVRWIANPEVLQGCLNLLEELKESLDHKGFNEEFDKTILTKLYGSYEGQEEKERWQKTLFDSYLAWLNASKCSDQEREQNGCASPQKCKENSLGDVNEEIRRLERYRKEHAEIWAFKLELESLRRSVPEGPRMDQLLRSETTIFREIGQIQNQLERLQRQRLGQEVPPPINLDVTAP